jgi:DNA-binding CsgD family transcriptional regulator
LTLDITKGERDVLFRLAQGYERSDIAASLDVSVSTVNGRLYDAQRRNSLRNVNHLLAVFVGETVLAAARAQEGPEDEG